LEFFYIVLLVTPIKKHKEPVIDSDSSFDY